MNSEQLDFLIVVNSWNIRGRYSDFTKALHNHATAEYVQKQMQKAEAIKTWLEEKIIEAEIAGCLAALEQNGFGVQKAILFGSMAKGNPHEYSDIDLAMWSKNFTSDYFSNIERTAFVKRHFKNIELHPFTLHETADNNLFIEEINATGKVVYES